MKKVFLFLMVMLLAISLVSCGDSEKTNDDGGLTANDDFNTSNVTLTSAYNKAQILGFEGTLDEFIELISGEDGKDGANGNDGANGADGVSIENVEVNDDGELIVVLSNGNNINCGKVKGTDGKDGVDGNDGAPGKDGANGKTPYIQDGYWYIDGINTGVKAEGVDGTDGTDGAPGQNGTDGKPGEDGKTPTIEISDDGYWVINGVKTEYKAIGTDGAPGQNGTDGKPGEDGKTPTIEISEDGYWVINGVKSDVKAEAVNGDKGDKGDTGATIEKVEFDEEGRLVITLTNGTVLDPIELPKKEEHVHTFGNWINYAGNANVYCENRLFYHICSECKTLEWKSGSYEDHIFSTITVTPTCTEEGYDKKTCSTCGYFEKFNFTDKIEHNYNVVTTLPTCVSQGFDEKTCLVCDHYIKTNYTVITDHTWNTEYTFDGSYHWQECSYCDATTEKEEHVIDESGYCTVCNQPITSSEGVMYDVSADGTYAEVIGYNGTSKNIIIADTYNGTPVTNIFNSAFEQTDIESIIIPGSIKNIGGYSFYNCRNLVSVTIANGLISVGYSAFSGCSSLENIVLPDSLITIGNSAFSGCRSLENIVLPDSLITIEISAFSSCSSLKSITIPYGVTTINYYTFNGCVNLTSVTIPDSVTSISNAAFSDCNPELYNEYAYGKYVGDSNNPYAVLIGLTNYNLGTYTIHENVRVIGAYAFSGCSRLTTVFIPETVVGISEYAFYHCTALTSFIIPQNIKIINDYTFSGCTSLETITIPDSVTSIDYKAFYDCSSLVNAILPPNLISIGACAFEKCSSLTSIVLPESVISIGESAFQNCTKLEFNIFEHGVYSTKFLPSENNPHFAFIGQVDPVYTNNYCYIHPDTQIIADGSQSSRRINSLIIPEKVTHIGKTFDFCNNLSYIIIGSSVKNISEGAFESCNKLESVFYNGTKERWNEILGHSFLTTDTEIYFYSEEPPSSEGKYWHYVDGVPIIWPEYVAPVYSEGLEFTSNGDGTCFVSGIGTCTDTILYVPPTSPSGDAVKSLGAKPSQIIDSSSFHIFEDSGIIEVHIPYSIEYIHPSVWIGATEIRNIAVHEDNPYYKSIDGNLYSKDGNTIVRCAPAKEDTEFTIAKNVIEIGKYAFLYCENITYVIFENTYDWYFTDNDILISGYVFTSAELSDTTIAATYLKSTYCHCWLKKN